MIQPMQHLSLLVFYKDYSSFVEELRGRGVLHIYEDKKKSAENVELGKKLVLLRQVNEISRLFVKRSRENACLPEGQALQWEQASSARDRLLFYCRLFQMDNILKEEVTDGEVISFLENRFKEVEQIKQRLAALEKEAAVYAPWGKLPREQMAALEKAGWELRFYSVASRKYLPEWETQFNSFVIHVDKGVTYFVTVMPQQAGQGPEADVVHFPAMDLEEIERQEIEMQARQALLEKALTEAAALSVGYLAGIRTEILESTDMLKVRDASRQLLEEKVVALEGWVPEANKADMDAWLAGKDVVYQWKEPSPEDRPPILLKNNSFARLFEFIGELYSLPDYREIDLTPFFAPFFVLFFGFCLGDAGYGLLILLAVTLYKFKAKPSFRPVLSLAQWLGFSTVVMGMVGGTFFGISLLDAKVAWLERFKAYMLDSQQLFNLALVIGVLQIVFGMCLKVANLWKQFGLPAALSTIGWLVAILGGGACYWLSSQGYEVTVPAYAILIVAGLLVFVFNNLHRNVLVNVGAGIWDTYNMVTGLLGDTLSYIRLFALGISSAVLGLVFNDLALNMSGDIPVLKQILMLVILVFGHGVNLFMACLGSFVHPMRLTFVEFYKNAGFEGGGKKYRPFSKR